MKTLYLKGYKWLLSQNQQVRIVFLGYRWYEALAKHIKPFLKSIKVKRTSVPGLYCSSAFYHSFAANAKKTRNILNNLIYFYILLNLYDPSSQIGFTSVRNTRSLRVISLKDIYEDKVIILKKKTS